MIYPIIFFSVGVACILGAPTDVASSDKQQPTVIPIISQSEELELNGTYKFSYETGNGIKREETSYDKVLPKASGRSHSSEEGGDSNESDESNEIHVQQGSYSYTAPDGSLITVRYIADENGFRPIGSHLPKAPSPIPTSFNAKSGRTLKQADSSSSESAQSVKVNSEQLVSAVASTLATEVKPAEDKPAQTTSVTPPNGEEPRTTQSMLSSDKVSDITTSNATPSQSELKSTESEPKIEVTESTITSTKPNEISEPESGSGFTPETNEISEGTLKQLDNTSSESAQLADAKSASEETVPAIASRTAAGPESAEDKPTENTLVVTSDEEPKTTETTLPSRESSDIANTTPFQSEPKNEATESSITSTQPDEISESESGSVSSPMSKVDDSEQKIELSTQTIAEEHLSVTTDSTSTQSVSDASSEMSATTLSDNTKTDADFSTTTTTIDNEETTRSVTTEALTEESTDLPSSTEAPSSEEVSTSSSSS